MKLIRLAVRNILCFEVASQRHLTTTAIMKRYQRRNKSQSLNNDPFSLHNVVKGIEKFAPLSLAESWDNVGLLVEPPSLKQVKRVLLTNDLSESVLAEALDIGVQLIIAYHPLIFRPIKSVRTEDWKEAIVGNLLEKKIALYSPHTAWDCVEGGVNDWLAEAFGKDSSVEPLKKHDDGANMKIVSALFDSSESAEKAMSDINAALTCSIHTFQEKNGKVWLKIYVDNEYLCLPHLHSATKVELNQHKKISSRINAGLGRKVLLKESITLQTAVSLVKSHLGLPDVAVATVPGEKYESTVVKTIAICAGSGGSVLNGVDADLYLTGEMSHHEVLDIVHKGTHVILTRHSNSERGFLHVAAKHHLKRLLPEVEFIVSSVDKDPLETK
ncbi:NIF3-like protein 1 [Frankliniella occidentalis]|uniref:NIF3-like protein 1 n=1 Tax=Frankliniella occidentalis TaxID=133901 RepID=A0A6J1S0A3_FRAOC|nr:NIF3-like protein 1 [Frankliniella occidentalis]